MRKRRERNTYRQRTGGRRRDKQDVTHLRQVHSCSRLQRSQHGGGERNKKRCERLRFIQSVIRTRAPERLAWRRLHAVSGHRDADELVQDAFGDSRTGES